MKSHPVTFAELIPLSAIFKSLSINFQLLVSSSQYSKHPRWYSKWGNKTFFERFTFTGDEREKRVEERLGKSCLIKERKEQRRMEIIKTQNRPSKQKRQLPSTKTVGCCVIEQHERREKKINRKGFSVFKSLNLIHFAMEFFQILYISTFTTCSEFESTKRAGREEVNLNGRECGILIEI